MDNRDKFELTPFTHENVEKGLKRAQAVREKGTMATSPKGNRFLRVVGGLLGVVGITTAVASGIGAANDKKVQDEIRGAGGTTQTWDLPATIDQNRQLVVNPESGKMGDVALKTVSRLRLFEMFVNNAESMGVEGKVGVDFVLPGGGLLKPGDVNIRSKTDALSMLQKAEGEIGKFAGRGEPLVGTAGLEYQWEDGTYQYTVDVTYSTADPVVVEDADGNMQTLAEAGYVGRIKVDCNAMPLNQGNGIFNKVEFPDGVAVSFFPGYAEGVRLGVYDPNSIPSAVVVNDVDMTGVVVAPWFHLMDKKTRDFVDKSFLFRMPDDIRKEMIVQLRTTPLAPTPGPEQVASNQ